MNEDMLFATEDMQEEDSSLQAETVVESTQYLIFNTDDLKFGVNADYVVEIINNLIITHLPMLPDFIRGIINLRGQMIPIVDVRMRLAKPSYESNDPLVIVLDYSGTQIGIMVDSVDQMIDIPDANILPVPAQSAQELVSGMCSLPDGSGTMMVLDCEQLMPHG